eukprot:12911074-Prorocentrum_lima.AAC.1
MATSSARAMASAGESELDRENPSGSAETESTQSFRLCCGSGCTGGRPRVQSRPGVSGSSGSAADPVAPGVRPRVTSRP